MSDKTLRTFRLRPHELLQFEASGMSWSKFLRGTRKNNGLDIEKALRLNSELLTENGN